MLSEGFFLGTPISRAEYIIIESKCLSPEIRALYQIDELIAEDGCLNIKITKGMYILKQSSVVT